MGAFGRDEKADAAAARGGLKPAELALVECQLQEPFALWVVGPDGLAIEHLELDVVATRTRSGLDESIGLRLVAVPAFADLREDDGRAHVWNRRRTAGMRSRMRRTSSE